MAISFISKEDQNIHYTVDCYQKLNLLGHAQMEELFLGSECGGHGVCGADRIWIDPIEQKTKLNSLTENEVKLLSSDQIKKGYRLSCQAYPNQDDLEIKVFCPVLKKQNGSN